MRSNDEAKANLAEEIRAGRCVAFIGAGFSAPLCRDWDGLLRAVAEEASPGIAALVPELVKQNEHEVAAQLLEDDFAAERLFEIVRNKTRRHNPAPADLAKMTRRQELLAGIPFSAVLTTNFDDLLRGHVLDRQTYAMLLRGADRRWLENRFWHRDLGTPVLKLHGDLRGNKGITLSRRGYRARLYAEPGYLNTLRTVFLTKTVFYLGFSFKDPYLNELRSETLSYVDRGADTPTTAYALMADKHDSVIAHYAKHEGMHVFNYESSAGSGHGFVDEFLTELHLLTNPTKVMGPRLHGRKILWADPSEQNNRFGHRFLRDAAQGLCAIDVARSPAEALVMLDAQRDPPYDLVITRWGWHPHERPADGEELLLGMRARGFHVPVVVFASGFKADENRERALRLGALEYTSSWDALFEAIDRRFGAPPE